VSNDDPAADVSPTPPLRLVRGDASPEEVAALVAVLSAAGGGDDDPDTTPRPRSRWASRESALRRPLAPGPGAWRASGLPR
jgi:hypothetical protein